MARSNIYIAKLTSNSGYTKASVELSYTSLVTEVSYTTPVASISYVALAAGDIKLGDFVIYQVVDDSFISTDTIFLTVNKPFYEAISTTDVYRPHFYKNVSDSANHVDAKYFDVTKVFSNTADATQLLSFDLQRPVSDAAAFSSDTTYNFGKNLADTATIAEVTSYVFAKSLVDQAVIADPLSLSLFKPTSDASTATDVATALVGLYKQDTVAFSDGIDSYTFAKALRDTIQVTDDLDGGAGVDDDQNMQFVKNRTDLATGSDLFSRQVSYVRAFANTAAYTDATAFTVSKLQDDSSVVQDSIAYQVSYVRSFADALATSVHVTIGVGKNFADSSGFVDNDIKSLLKSATDDLGVGDSGYLNMQNYVDNPFYFAQDYVGYNQTF